MAEELFWNSATRNGDCLEWKKSLNKGGYGQVNFHGKIRLAHRAAFELSTGIDPIGMLVCHVCDNRKCINPNHLFLGAHNDNNNDMFNKGRGHIFDGTYITGLNNPNGKIDPASFEAAHLRRKNGKGLSEIADSYGVTKQAIWYVLNRDLALSRKRDRALHRTKAGTSVTVSHSVAAGQEAE